MSKDWYQDICDFHDLVVEDRHNEGKFYPHHPNPSNKALRITLIEEEVKETIDAIQDNNLEKVADGITDSIVVLLGTAVTYGIDIRPIWDEIHKTNMAKLGGKKREDGKLLKPDGWKPPEITNLLINQILLKQ
jgi:NTP pyrophosphatase (non-canonical NTP hydrolase)